MKKDLMCFQSVPLAHNINALKAVHKVFCCTFRAYGKTEIPSLPHFSLLPLLLIKAPTLKPNFTITSIKKLVAGISS